MTSYGVEAYYRHGHEGAPPILRAPADVDALVDTLLAEPVENRIAALYHRDRKLNHARVPDHEFLVAVAPETGAGALMYSGYLDGGAGTWFSRGESGTTGTERYCYMGHERDFPADARIPLDLVRAAAREFLDTGGRRPTCVSWQP